MLFRSILDPEVVEASNLARTTYSVADIGMNKADVLTKQLLNINPAIEVVPYVCELADLGTDGLKNIVLASDLILPLTDDPKAQSVINHFSYYLGKPRNLRVDLSWGTGRRSHSKYSRSDAVLPMLNRSAPKRWRKRRGGS